MIASGDVVLFQNYRALGKRPYRCGGDTGEGRVKTLPYGVRRRYERNAGEVVPYGGSAVTGEGNTCGFAGGFQHFNGIQCGTQVLPQGSSVVGKEKAVRACTS